MSKEILLDPRFRKIVREYPKPTRKQIGTAIDGLQQQFGDPIVTAASVCANWCAIISSCASDWNCGWCSSWKKTRRLLSSQARTTR